MISSVLRVFSLLILLASLGAIASSLYFMASDLQAVEIREAQPLNLKLNSSGLSFDLGVNVTYRGKYVLEDFVLIFEINGREFRSKPISIAGGVNEVIVSCLVLPEELSRNITIRAGVSVSYMGMVRLTSKMKPMSYPAPAILLPYGLISARTLNESHVIIECSVVSRGVIEVDGVAYLIANGEAVSRCKIPELNADESLSLKWIVRRELIDNITGIDVYFNFNGIPIRVYRWEFRGV